MAPVWVALPVMGSVCIVAMLILLWIARFVPRLVIAGMPGSGKTRLYYALTDNQLVRTTHSCQSNVYKGTVPALGVEAEVIDLSSDTRTWSRDVRGLRHRLYGAMVILFITDRHNFSGAARYVRSHLATFSSSMIYVVQPKDGDDYTTRLQGDLFHELGRRVPDRQFVRAELSLDKWDVSQLLSTVQTIM